MTWREFESLYASYFRPLGPRDGIEEWQRFVSQVTPANDEHLRNAVRKCGMAYAEKRLAGADPMAPRIPDIAVNFNRERDAARKNVRVNPTQCKLCRGHKHLILASVLRGKRIPGRWPLPLEETDPADVNGFEVWDCPACSRTYSDQRFAEALKRAGVADDIPHFVMYERLGVRLGNSNT